MSEQTMVGSGGGGEGRHRSDLVRVFAGAGVVVSLYLLSRSNYLFFHSIIEVFSIVIAFGVFMVAWNTRRWVANDYLLFLGISFLFVGGIDFLHTLAYPGMGILPDSSTNLASQLWILARCLQGVSLLAAPLFLSRRVRLVPAFSFYALVAVLGVASIRYWEVFPDTFIEGQGLTTFKIASEYIICGILTGALVFLYRQRAGFEERTFRMLSAAIVVTIASEIAFTLYGHAYGFPNMAGHLLKVVAFYLVYQAVIATNLSSPYAFLFRSVEESHVKTQHERDRARSYLHIAGSIILVLDVDGRVGLINRRGCEVVGYPEDEILGKPWFESFLPSRIRKDVRVLFDTLMAGEIEPFEYAEFPVITSSGEERLIAWHNSVLRENGKIVGTISSGEDVTERTKAEEETRLLAAFPAENPNPVLRADEEGEIVFANEASAPVLQTWGVGVGDRLPAEWQSRSKAARDDGAALRAELECGERVFEITVAPLEERGEVNLYALDVTERRRAETALRESEGKYHSLFESSKEAIVLTAPDGRVVDANPAFLELFGYTQDDLAGLAMPDLVVDGPDLNDFFARLHGDGQILDDECRFRKKDGTVMDCIRTIVVWRNEAGEVTAHQGLVRDVTQSKRDQAELERSREELRALAVHLQLVREEERNAVAWELHDEVGQALAVLKMDIDMCGRHLPAEALVSVRPKMEAMMGLLDNTIDRLRNLYSDLRPGMLDDLGLAATVEWQTSEFERRSGIKCRVVKADPVQLREADCALALYRAFQEALDNIVRNSGATEFEVELKQHDGRVTLRVSDNGRGITEDELTSPSALGLAGMRERVLACGGKLVVSRGDDGGTIVAVSAPAALPEQEGGAA